MPTTLCEVARSAMVQDLAECRCTAVRMVSTRRYSVVCSGPFSAADDHGSRVTGNTGAVFGDGVAAAAAGEAAGRLAASNVQGLNVSGAVRDRLTVAASCNE